MTTDAWVSIALAVIGLLTAVVGLLRAQQAHSLASSARPTQAEDPVNRAPREPPGE